jgi:hypothetical protein
VNQDKDDKEIDADSIINSGDLVLFNAYKKNHKVNPIVCEGDQIGRMHLFIPSIRDYWFPKTYFFKDDPKNLFFSVPPSKEEEEKQRAKHLLALDNGTAVPVDLNKI